jgi:rRNA biogenesis protein RRP5
MSSKEFKAPVTKRKKKEEEDFPRGGASGLTPLEYKDVARQADSSLFSVSSLSPMLVLSS